MIGIRPVALQPLSKTLKVRGHPRYNYKLESAGSESGSPILLLDIQLLRRRSKEIWGLKRSPHRTSSNLEPSGTSHRAYFHPPSLRHPIDCQHSVETTRYFIMRRKQQSKNKTNRLSRCVLDLSQVRRHLAGETVRSLWRHVMGAEDG